MLVLLLPAADDLQLKLQAVLRSQILSFLPGFEIVGVGLHGQQPKSMDEQFVRYHRGVLEEKDLMKRHGGYFRNDDPPERVGKSSINALHLHFQEFLRVAHHADIDILLEPCEVEDLLLGLILHNLLLLKLQHLLPTHQQYNILRQL